MMMRWLNLEEDSASLYSCASARATVMTAGYHTRWTSPPQMIQVYIVTLRDGNKRGDCR
jgi:hypothetical protein